jgi:hypothetical protein
VLSAPWGCSKPFFRRQFSGLFTCLCDKLCDKLCKAPSRQAVRLSVFLTILLTGSRGVFKHIELNECFRFDLIIDWAIFLAFAATAAQVGQANTNAQRTIWPRRQS